MGQPGIVISVVVAQEGTTGRLRAFTAYGFPEGFSAEALIRQLARQLPGGAGFRTSTFLPSSLPVPRLQGFRLEFAPGNVVDSMTLGFAVNTWSLGPLQIEDPELEISFTKAGGPEALLSGRFLPAPEVRDFLGLDGALWVTARFSDNPNASVSPRDLSVGGTLIPAGICLAGNTEFFGKSVELDLRFHQGAMAMSTSDLAIQVEGIQVLRIGGAGGQPLTFSFDPGTGSHPPKPGLRLDGAVTVLGVTRNAIVNLTSRNFMAQLGGEVGVLGTSLSGNLRVSAENFTRFDLPQDYVATFTVFPIFTYTVSLAGTTKVIFEKVTRPPNQAPILGVEWASLPAEAPTGAHHLRPLAESGHPGLRPRPRS